MIIEGLTPEQRTLVLFDKYVDQLADEFLDGDGLEIGIANSSRRIRVSEVDPFGKDPESHLKRVGQRWNAMEKMQVGDLWNPVWIKTTQSLVVAKDRGGIGACVRLVRAEYFDKSKGLYVTDLVEDDGEYHQVESDIARFLGLERNNRSRLAFLDDTNILYLLPTT